MGTPVDCLPPVTSESKPKLTVGAEVFAKNTNKPQQEGEGILCTVTKVIGEGKQRR